MPLSNQYTNSWSFSMKTADLIGEINKYLLGPNQYVIFFSFQAQLVNVQSSTAYVPFRKSRVACINSQPISMHKITTRPRILHSQPSRPQCNIGHKTVPRTSILPATRARPSTQFSHPIAIQTAHAVRMVARTFTNTRRTRATYCSPRKYFN